jgi:hypothetical protein
MTDSTTRLGNTSTQQLQNIVRTAFEQGPTYYANGFVNGLGMADAYIVLQTNEQSVAVVNMSLSMAKTMANNLLVMIQNFENQTGQKVMTLDELQGRAQS